jgi:hypothetical protein
MYQKVATTIDEQIQKLKDRGLNINYDQFTDKLTELLLKYPSIDQNALGLKKYWLNEPLWLYEMAIQHTQP